MVIDARSHRRAKLAARPIGGVFMLRAANRHFRLRCVDNVSVSGTGLYLPATLPKNTQVTLTYSEYDWHVTIQGYVAWCKNLPKNDPNGDMRYPVGIRFAPNNADENTLFFLALREYLDPFGGPLYLA